ncbi:unnamed protein product [Vicia faba]|uniref:Amino acid transporter transmembrane domain-containing protein n=1 Tax=Vicia faba TaxID=3906 RepID=A0AAV0ZL50_VICFA|nr:unnamed protein product [Vicia faba]
MVENISRTNLSYRGDTGGIEEAIDDAPLQTDSKFYDDDGRVKRTGTVWTTCSHIITGVIGSGVLSLACGDTEFGKRNYTFMDAVHNILGGPSVKICGVVQYLNLFGSAIGYNIAAAMSMMEIRKSYCVHSSHGEDPCHVSGNAYMIAFGVAQLFFSQIPDFHNTWWLSIVAAVMSFFYSTIALALGISKVAETGTVMGSLTGISIGTVTPAQKVWGVFQALGNIAFAYSYSFILLEIQDTIKSPPSEGKAMKKAAKLSIGVTTTFYLLCGCTGYAAFGDAAPVHLFGAYQVYAQPLFAFVEKEAGKKWPKIDKGFEVKIPGLPVYNQNIFMLVWRTIFVIVATLIAMLIPFFNDVLGVIGALGFWPLTVYFPVEMYIIQKKIPKWSRKWICLEIMSTFCLFVSVVAGLGSLIGVWIDLKKYKPFSLEN